MHYLTNKIYNGDVFEFLDILPDDIFDLAIVDPPYNLKVDEWDIFSSEDEFLNFSFIKLSNLEYSWYLSLNFCLIFSFSSL